MENNSEYPWSSREEKDEYFEIMNDFYQEEHAFYMEQERITNRLLKVIKHMKGDEWFLELMEYSKEAETHYPFVVVKTPKGNSQKDDYDLLGDVWVEQFNSYPCEDCYHGTVTIKIDEKRYLEMPF